MRVVIAGAHGKIAMRLARALVARGDTVIGLIRNPDQADDVAATGAEPVLCDLEQATVPEIAAAAAGADAAVFAAGAGPGSGAARKLTMDRDGAIKLLEATAGHYVIVSSVGAENPPDDDDVFSVYLRAKAEADAAVQASGRDWTVIRPGVPHRRPANWSRADRHDAVPRPGPARRRCRGARGRSPRAAGEAQDPVHQRGRGAMGGVA